MKTLFTTFIILLSLTLIHPTTQTNTPEKSPQLIPEGKWFGQMNVMGNKMRMMIHLSKDQKGNLKGNFHSISQGGQAIPIDKITFEKENALFQIERINGTYKGKIIDHKHIEGKWSQNGMEFTLNLEKVKKIPGLNRPQHPKPPFPYNQEEVTYQNKQAGATLAGTLSLPNSKEKFPVVLLITGSGPQDRDETVMEHKPFLVLADHLTRKGIAVLRVDDRGIGKSTGPVKDLTSKDFAEDVKAGVEFLKKHPRINPKQIGLAGHSEGGMIAPMVAAQDPDIAFIILMAAPGMKGIDLLYQQRIAIFKSMGITGDFPKQRAETNRKMDQAVIDAEPLENAKETIRKIATESGLPPIMAKGIIRQMVNHWFKFFLQYDPIPTLKKVKCPVLAINGEKDVQVVAAPNLKAIQEALTQSGNKNVTIKSFPNLNHLFQTAKTGAVNEYMNIEETFAPAALETISQWLLKQVKL